MGDEHLSTISATESDEVIKSSVENLVPIPSEFEGIFDDTCDNSPPLDVLNDHFEIFSNFNDDCTLSDDDSFESIDFKSDTSLSYSDNSLPEFETFSDHTEETRSGSTTTHADNSLPEYDSFHFEIEPDQGELSSVVMEDILGEPRVHVPNVFFLPELETRFLIQGYSSKSNPRDFYLGIHFLSPLSGKITSDFSESPMMIFGGDIPFLDVLFSDGKIPSGEIKVHIEVLSVLWGNRLPIPDGSLPLSR
ncbi:hypothetical protein Tco_0605831 [Tanacetum coccineum]